MLFISIYYYFIVIGYVARRKGSASKDACIFARRKREESGAIWSSVVGCIGLEANVSES
jgi:hypothetical protein